MATSIVQFRVDEDLKVKATAVFEKLGIDMSTALRMFLKRTVLENGIPFPMTLQNTYDSEAILKAARGLTTDAKQNGSSEKT